jgi:hypothetical protein
MAWYNPLSWGKEEETPATTSTTPTAPAPVGGPYGGRKRKTRRHRKGSRKSRGGRKSNRS